MCLDLRSASMHIALWSSIVIDPGGGPKKVIFSSGPSFGSPLGSVVPAPFDPPCSSLSMPSPRTSSPSFSYACFSYSILLCHHEHTAPALFSPVLIKKTPEFTFGGSKFLYEWSQTSHFQQPVDPKKKLSRVCADISCRIHRSRHTFPHSV